MSDPPDDGDPTPEEPSTRRRIRLLRRAEPEPEPPPRKKRVVLRRRTTPPEGDVVLDEAFETSLDGGPDEEGLRRLARVLAADFVPAVARRILESGSAALSEELIRRALLETPMPREVGGFLAGSADTMRRELNRVIAREVAGFLKSVNLAGELQKILTSLSLEIKTEIRFVPNDRAAKSPDSPPEPDVKPDVKSRVRLKRTPPRA